MATDSYVIGLIGQIATGKSTVARMLAALGACVIDADRLAHATMLSGAPAYGPIIARFGASVVGCCGQIDRARLGAIVFADAGALADLEGIIHPLVVAEALARIASCPEPVCVLEAIKLHQSGLHHHCHVVWAVACGRDQQVQRLMANRGLSRAQAELRIDAQGSAEETLHRADLVIDNSGDLEHTWRQVCAAWDALPGCLPPAPAAAWQSFSQEKASC